MGLINRKAVKDTILEEAIKHDARTTKTWSRVTEASIDRVERETLAVIKRLVKPDRLPRVGKTVNLT
jgi:hypothetical protein